MQRAKCPSVLGTTTSSWETTLLCIVISLRYSRVLPTSCVFRSGYIKWKSVLYLLSTLSSVFLGWNFSRYFYLSSDNPYLGTWLSLLITALWYCLNIVSLCFIQYAEGLIGNKFSLLYKTNVRPCPHLTLFHVVSCRLQNENMRNR